MPEISRFAAINQKPQQIEMDETVVNTGQPNDQEIGRLVNRTTGRPRGKRDNPDFDKVGIYLRADTRKRAARKWEDEGSGGDFSDLVETLLKTYLGDQ